MIHHSFIVNHEPWGASEVLAVSAEDAVQQYVREHNAASIARYIIPVWQDGVFFGYVQTSVVASVITGSVVISVPPCHVPIPAPVVQPPPPPPPPSAVQRFKACAPADREVALMALEKRVRSLGAEANAHIDIGADGQADILMGQQTAVLAALEVLREMHKEGGR